MHRIQCLQEKVVVYRLCRLSPDWFLAVGVGRVEDGNVAKRNVGYRHVEVVLKRLCQFLESFNTYDGILMQRLQHLACHEVFLVGHDVGILVFLLHGIHEHTDTR